MENEKNKKQNSAVIVLHFTITE
ncbi:uncharacterized protein METZ01_LOCUS127892 [marine metagenome]|uniref:Uncharacterized protein n=1 Tax=marine metagenome TaxID=408172 RepID=A0A381YDC8_9ZZZZ